MVRISGKNVQEIYKMFEEVAKNNKQFAKQFYRYRGLDYIPYKNDTALKRQVEGLARMTANTYINIANTTGIGFLFEDINGQMIFKNIQQSYYEVIDRSTLAISQGKSTFQEEMRKTLKELGHNGIVVYESGHTRRLDSAIRMNVLDGIRELNQETANKFGAEYGADGYEVSVHIAPAPDHADIQGRQFKKEEYEKLQEGETVKDINNIKRELGHSKNGSYRKIEQWNCYHKAFPIVLGVSKSEYTEEQLRKIKEDNEKGFVYEGKHYTLYEGTQLQRRIETEIRKNKDTQILARASGDDFKELAQESQAKINMLKDKYDDLCKTSGLKPQLDRMSVSGYRRIKV